MGLRRSEALALRWSDADLARSILSITQSMHRLRTGEVVFRQPKTKTSRRIVRLSPSACLVLRRHRDNEEAMKGSLSDDGLIFCHVDGAPLLPDTVTHAWVKVVRRCGLRGIRLHDCRHTHASLMFDQGSPLEIVSRRLGHSSTRVTSDIYLHPSDDVEAAAATKLDDLIVPHSPERENETVR